MEQLFVYGTLKDPQIRYAVIGKHIHAVKDFIKGFVLDEITIEGASYPIIVKTSKDSDEVYGEVIQVDKPDLQKLDLYEGDEYRRIIIETMSCGPAWVYSK